MSNKKEVVEYLTQIEDSVKNVDMHGKRTHRCKKFRDMNSVYIPYSPLMEEICGNRIGMGNSRIVFELAALPKEYIVKVDFELLRGLIKQEGNDELFSKRGNIVEANVWESEKDTKIGAVLCPIVWHSKDFHIIVMPRAKALSFATKVIPRNVSLKTKIGVIVDSSSDKNWGVIDGKQVLIDYGSMLPYPKHILEAMEVNNQNQ